MSTRQSKIPWIALSLMLIICAGCSQIVSEPGKFKPRSEPDGFRGIKWGTDVATLSGTLSGMKYINRVRTGQKIYVQTVGDLKIEGVNFKEIIYCFQENKFVAVEAGTSGYINCLKLESALFKKFGWGRKTHGHRVYSWLGEKTFMSLSYNKNRKDVLLVLGGHER